MKEAIGGISIFQIVIVFILLFTGIMCLTINQSKAFSVKDEIITIIENDWTYIQNYELSTETIEKVANHLVEAGYRITGKCPDDSWTGYTRNGQETKSNPAFCIKANNVTEAFHSDLRDKCKNNLCEITSEDYPAMVYYDIVLFYQLDIPVLNDIMNFKIQGSTKVLFG